MLPAQNPRTPCLTRIYAPKEEKDKSHLHHERYNKKRQPMRLPFSLSYSYLHRQKVVCHCEAVRLWQSQSFFSLLCAKGGGLPLGKTEGLRIV